MIICTIFTIEFRSLQFSLPIFNRVTILDRAKTMIWEIKDDNKDNFVEALGMAIYIESEQPALSYVSIFNNLWNQSEMYEKLQAQTRILCGFGGIKFRVV